MVLAAKASSACFSFSVLFSSPMLIIAGQCSVARAPKFRDSPKKVVGALFACLGQRGGVRDLQIYVCS